jgi:molybdate transport system ATP-binding protein
VLEFDVGLRRGEFTLHAAASLGPGVTGLAGPSGCGKSTLLSVLSGLLKPDRGRITFDGEALFDSVRGLDVAPWQRGFALVFQDGQLFPHLDVRANLLYGWQRRPPHLRRFEFDPVCELLEIGALATRRPAQLSGGERQRVALGRALLASPRLLLLDEPLASLDDRLKQQILPYLARVRDETHLPMLYVSHSRGEVEYLAGRTLQMAEGAITG